MALHPWDDADAVVEEWDFEDAPMSRPAEHAFEDSGPELPVAQAAEPLAAVTADEDPPIPTSPFEPLLRGAEPVEPPPKRRRISGKQSVKLGVAEPVAALNSQHRPKRCTEYPQNMVNNFIAGNASKKSIVMRML